ncbi:helix-turn-helix domain-containing protein [Bacillus thuringiensis]|uniref:HTH cro/C1-type domain-containing protein n=1 Tax=Bacillus thuringiensis DB27 TaxID=1431339 RepID=W8YAA2_BACTU|nr:helix-turn-helix transcriptional regulator [Bacillus thuringiensis]MEB9339903.1 helix-turn-helix transcriptional regulator [Bacillus cereus]MBG9633160.1 XRE family transcriptional regulator [Bacillus thuringiensis]MBG9665109.1 XRE family transcriptional regulator [Bacillus thuringiensis]MBH0352492.1 XRE family transcriptional regulator [Bacillus thuringiensis]PGY40122.1 XRE family transcriptional regulator [Bacillus thuringiensis]
MPTLKQLRKERGYTCKYIADSIGISEPYYWYIENGERRVYHDLIVKIARVLEVKINDIEI